VKDQRVYLEHIRDALEDIATYTNVGREAFFADRMRQDATLRKLQVIGEAAADALPAGIAQVVLNPPLECADIYRRRYLFRLRDMPRGRSAMRADRLAPRPHRSSTASTGRDPRFEPLVAVAPGEEGPASPRRRLRQW
jgi:hypothetical protein